MPIIKRSLETDMPATPLAADESGTDLPMPLTEAPLAEIDAVNTTNVTDAMDIAIPTNSTIEIEKPRSTTYNWIYR